MAERLTKLVTYGVPRSLLAEQYWQELRTLTDRLVEVGADDPSIARELGDAEALLVDFGVPVDKGMMEKASKLRYIGVLATAFDKIDAPFARSRDIAVTNLGGYSTEAVAEFTIAVLLEHLRQLEKAKQEVRKGNFSFEGYSIHEIKGKAFGVLGLGKIGGRVAEIALGFGANVRYWSRHRHPEAEAKGIAYSELDALLESADYLSINLALNAETNGIINRQRIQALKSGAVVVKTAPIALVDFDALTERLAKGDITLITDSTGKLTNDEWTKLNVPSCTVYPHIAFASQEAKTNMQETFVANVSAFLAGKPQNVVS